VIGNSAKQYAEFKESITSFFPQNWR